MDEITISYISPEVCQKFIPFFGDRNDIHQAYKLMKEALQQCSKTLKLDNGPLPQSFKLLNNDIEYIKDVLVEYSKPNNSDITFIISCVYNFARKFDSNVHILKDHIKIAKNDLKKLKVSLNKQNLLNQLNNLESLAQIIVNQNLKSFAFPAQNCIYAPDTELCKKLVHYMVAGDKIMVNNILDDLQNNHEKRKKAPKSRAFS